MRAYLLELSGRHFVNALPCSKTNREIGMDESLSDKIIYPQIDIFLQSAQELSVKEIEQIKKDRVN